MVTRLSKVAASPKQLIHAEGGALNPLEPNPFEWALILVAIVHILLLVYLTYFLVRHKVSPMTSLIWIFTSSFFPIAGPLVALFYASRNVRNDGISQ